MRESASQPAGPLAGIRVLDLSRLAPGPFASMVLADLGADVLLIEPPAGAVSHLERPWDPPDPERANAFDPLRRNKRSLVLNLKAPEGRQVLHRLAAEADVLLEGFRPGVAARLGADPATLSTINPRLIVCSVTGYGQTGPLAQVAGHDINYISMGGLLGFTGRPGQVPAIPGNIVADFAAGGFQAALAVLAALVARGRTGAGQAIDVAMTDGVLYLAATWAQGVLAGGGAPTPGGHFLNGALPQYTVYETADGLWLSIGALEDKFWQTLCSALGLEQYADRGMEPAAWPEIHYALTQIFRTRTRDEWAELLMAQEVCATPVLRMDEVLAHPHTRARGMIVELKHPRLGSVWQVGPAPKFSATPASVRSLPPQPGEHTEAVLAELGYAAEEIAALRQAAVVT